jgi:hypothetical protein
MRSAKAAMVYGILLGAASLVAAPEPAMSAAEFRANTFIAKDQAKPAIATLTDGGFVVVWQSLGQDGDGLGIYAQRYRSNSAPLGSEFRVNTTTAGAQQTPAIAALEDGGFVIAWFGGTPSSGQHVFAQRYSAAGTPVGGEFMVDAAPSTYAAQPAIAGTLDGGFVVIWTGYDSHFFGIFGQRYTAAGGKKGKAFRVNEYQQDTQQRPDVVRRKEGGFVVVFDSFWQDDGQSSGVYGQLYEPNGLKSGYVFRINSNTTSDQFEPRITTLICGDYVVAWTGNDGSQVGIFAQRYSPTGRKKGQEFRVNKTQTGIQGRPDITALPSGGFMVVWSSLGQDGSGFGVYGQRYLQNGDKLGGEFRINGTTLRDQSFPVIAPWSTEGFITVWDSVRQDSSGLGVYGRRFVR